MTRKFCLLLALGALFVCAASASTIVFTTIAVPTGTGAVYNTGSIPGAAGGAGGIGINDSLIVAGSFNPTAAQYQGFTYNATTPGPSAFTLPLPTCSAPCTGFQQPVNGGLFAQTAPHGINNNGTQTGLYEASTSQLNGFILGGSTDTSYGALNNPTGTISPGVPGQASNTSFFFNGIGNNGEVVGFYAEASTTHGFTYTGGTGPAYTGGTFTASASSSTGGSSLYLCYDAGTATEGTSNNFEAVNASGLIAGFCKVSGTQYGETFSGTAYDLFTFSGATQTEFFAINDSGAIGGDYIVGGVNEAFICSASEVASAISGGVNVNGVYTLSGCATYNASNAVTMGLTDPNAGATITQVYLSGMNNLGDFVGVFTDNDTGTFSFVAEPAAIGTPEPGTMALFGVAGGALLLVRKRRKS